MSTDIFDQIDALNAEIQAANPGDAQSWEQFRIRYLGSKNVLKDLFGQIGLVEAARKKEFGQRINAVKALAEEKFQSRAQSDISQVKGKKTEAPLDLSMPGEPWPQGTRHPVSIVMNQVIRIFEKIGFTIADGPEIEDDWHNFTAMNTPEDHPARDMQDTFYLSGSTQMLLRTHTSNVQSRVMKTRTPPIRIIAPGRVYRNETISARSHCQFHQVEGLYIDEQVSFADLKATMDYFAREMYGSDTKTRLRPSYFPFTEPSAEMDVYWGLKDETDHRITKGTGWLEVLGCGMVDPAVLENCGIDPEKYSGFAFGMGIERQAMLRYRIGDIRWFYENDLRFLQQFAGIV